jgi:phosphosulfolactate phosphohydrolase-like enzyme
MPKSTILVTLKNNEAIKAANMTKGAKTLTIRGGKKINGFDE